MHLQLVRIPFRFEQSGKYKKLLGAAFDNLALSFSTQCRSGNQGS